MKTIELYAIASMRPQLFAADHCGKAREYSERSTASMRPQLFAADHQRGIAQPAFPEVASMRPQLFAADHLILRRWRLVWLWSFNEAAAIRCGSLLELTRAMTA